MNKDKKMKSKLEFIVHNSKFDIRSRRGFSLIEVILFAAIGGAILFVVANMTKNVGQIEDFVNNKLNLAVIGPYREEKAFEKILKL